jgi:hypothetical protein
LIAVALTVLILLFSRGPLGGPLFKQFLVWATVSVPAVQTERISPLAVRLSSAVVDNRNQKAYDN